MTDDSEVAAAVTAAGSSRRWVRRNVTIILSVLGAAVLMLHVYLYFWAVELPWGIDTAVYSWGAVLAVIVFSIAFRMPRLLRQTPGDEFVAITEVGLSVLAILFLGIVAGRAMTNEVNFPPGGQFAFWGYLTFLVIVITVQVYLSIRYAERTIGSSQG